MGYSMLSGVNATYSSFFFVSLKPWDERKTPETSYDGIKAPSAASALARSWRHSHFPSRLRPFPASGPPAAPPSSWRIDPVRASISSPRTRKLFMAEARKRPELAGVMTTALFGVPQVGVNVDNAKAMTQQIPLDSLYQTVQTFMGGSLINYFNRFGLQWQVYVQADGDFRTHASNLGKFYVRNITSRWCR